MGAKQDSPFLYRRFSFTLLLLLFLGLFWACASDQTKPTPVTAKLGQIQQRLSGLAESYGKKNKDGFLSGVDPAAEGSDRLMARVIKDFEHFSMADLSIQVHRVEMGEKLYKTAVHWKGLWKSKTDQTLLERRGNAIFLMAASEDPKLIDVLGDSPFGVFR